MSLIKRVIKGAKNTHSRLNEKLQVWENAPITLEDYSAGEIIKSDGSKVYKYPAGKRLLILGEQVMDTCETPWCIETANTAFMEIAPRRNYHTPIRVLEVGFGLNIIANRIIQLLIGHGTGEYVGIELNKKVFEKALEWKKTWEEALKTTSQTTPGTKPNLSITVLQGDGMTVAEKLLKKHKKFDILISDTYDPSNHGVNDLQALEIYKRLVAKDGIFMFFASDPLVKESRNGHLLEKQKALIQPHFRHIITKRVDFYAPRSYTYVRGLTSLLVAGCKDPIL